MLTFREMSMEDLDAVMKIEEENFSTPWTGTSFFTFFIRDDNYFCCAFDGDTLVGYAGLTLMAPEGEVVNIAVAKERQGQKIGRRLLAHLLEEGEKRGITCVFLEVRVSNEPAKALYASAGFENVGRRKNYYEKPVEDAYIMKRG